mmetsp:Transcript_26863/g.75430  ORF Transcript_26863/g.75430 Transcript_26863/m.75430 type:complete len:246 (+) Transcript_26863:753-1490(+)
MLDDDGRHAILFLKALLLLHIFELLISRCEIVQRHDRRQRMVRDRWAGQASLLTALPARECLVPTVLAERAQFLVYDICGEHHIDERLPEAVQLFVRLVDAIPKVLELRFHQQLPRQIDRILLCHALILVQLRDGRFLLDQLGVGDTGVIDVMDQGGQKARELRQRIGSDAVRRLVQIITIRLLVLHVFIINGIGTGNNSRQQLHGRFHHMAGMREIVKRIVMVHGCDDANEFLDFRLDFGAQND